jgi:hypothetical protein
MIFMMSYHLGSLESTSILFKPSDNLIEASEQSVKGIQNYF